MIPNRYEAKLCDAHYGADSHTVQLKYPDPSRFSIHFCTLSRNTDSVPLHLHKIARIQGRWQEQVRSKLATTPLCLEVDRGFRGDDLPDWDTFVRKVPKINSNIVGCVFGSID